MAEEKMTVNKSSVHIDDKGNLTISDPKVIEQRKAKGVSNIADLKSKAAVSVGVVVSF